MAQVRLHEQMLELKLKHSERTVDQLCQEAAERRMGYTEFLSRVLEEEIGPRHDRGTQLRIQLAHFPFQKTLEQFDFGFQPSLDQRQVEELSTLRFVQDAGNIVLLGPPGVGKTHLAIAFGVRACLSGYSTYFITAHDLGRRLLASLADDTMDRKLLELCKYRLLIIDEMGYLPLERPQATVLFQLFARRYERGSVILTSNKSFGQWAEVFGGDSAVASAILDRLLHHAAVLNIRGPSYRLKDRDRELGLVTDPQRLTGETPISSDPLSDTAKTRKGGDIARRNRP
jgi:DNA replication protein DnaC